MAKVFPQITSELESWISRQRLFFVATAPISRDAHINLSPKGGECFRVLDPLTVAYQDYTGSGAETAAHLRENGRIVLMFCAFKGAPKIIRLHGIGTVIAADHPDFGGLASQFPANAGTRAIVRVALTRISDSCGYSVPLYQFVRAREQLDDWVASMGPEKLKEYRQEQNRRSIDGLPAFDADG